MAKRTCSVPACEREVHSKGWCMAHYARWRYYGDLKEDRPIGPRIPAPVPPCKIEGCDNQSQIKSRQLCTTHYMRFKRYGDPTHTPVPTAEERFWSNVVKGAVTDCWPWTGRLNKKEHGYGRISVNGKSMQAHVYAYCLLVGPVPKGLELDHLCRNHLCVNPAHLEPVTHRVNSLRGISIQAINARKTHCLRGHEFTPENTARTREGGRKCKACRRAAYRARQEEKRRVS